MFIKMNNNPYNRSPKKIVAQIPVFSKRNNYTDNYKKLDREQLIQTKKIGENPWIKETLWQEMEKSTLNLALKYCKSGQVLDVGVGLGRLLTMFPADFKKYGIDISFDFLKEAQKKNIEVCYGLVEELPYKKEYFDLVICTDVLEHVLDLNQTIKQILRVLKKGVMLIIRTPYKEDLSPYLDKKYPYQYAHLRNFDEFSLRLLFEKIFGFKFLESNQTGTVLKGHKYTLPLWFRQFLIKISPLTSRTSNILYRSTINWTQLLTPVYKYGLEINMIFKKT